jgi:PiT family inorganic phosphate transporter
LLLLVLLSVLAAEFTNGWTDAPNAIATVVSTKVLPPRVAVLLAVVLNTIGVLMGTAVAHTIGKGIVDAGVINLLTIMSAVLSVALWATLAAQFGLPTSESHALVAALAGAGLATAGPGVLVWSGWAKVLIGLGLSSFVGFTMSLTLSKGIVRLCANWEPVRARRLFDRLQIASSMFMAYNHGQNDGQKFMGVFTLALVIGGVLESFEIPLWVIFVCAGTMGLGTAFGGWRIIRRIGMQMVDLASWQGFAAETAASLTILGASQAGIPLSTTHTIVTSIMGTGAARRRGGVRWYIAREVVTAWVLTFPGCAAIAYVVLVVLRAATGG